MQFQTFSIDLANRKLCVQGQAVAVGARAFDVLLVLAERHGQVVSKHTLFSLAWPGVVVEENNLQVQIAALRRVLGKAAITTVSGRGYCLTESPTQSTPASGRPLSVVVQEGGLGAGHEVSRSAPLVSELDFKWERPSGALPRFIPRLYGRAQDLATLEALLMTQRLVTLTGAGGVGKTHLANSLALTHQNHWPDGVRLLRAEACTDGSSLLKAAWLCLGGYSFGRGEAQEALLPEQTTLKILCSVLQGKQLLLVVDNCEHVLQAMQVLLTALIENVPGLQVLATSQVPLRLPQEFIYQLNTLSLPAAGDGAEQAQQSGAVQLFVAQLQMLHQRYLKLTADELQHVIAICQQLDGMALALMMAAARVPLLGLQGVRAHLHDSMSWLEVAQPSEQISQRHMTLRSVIDWTYRLLDPLAAQVFRRLGLLVGSFGLGTARWVLKDLVTVDNQLLRVLEVLLNHGLLMVADDGVERYRLLHSHRVFAVEVLLANDEELTSRRRLSQAWLDYSDVLISTRKTNTLWVELPHVEATRASQTLQAIAILGRLRSNRPRHQCSVVNPD